MLTLLRRCVAAVVALGCLCSAASAIDLRNILTGYAIQSWGVNDGAPEGVVYSLAQDREGYLWLGTEVGLYRFDGMRFRSWSALSSSPLSSGAVQVLRTARDGSLWAGFRESGGVSRIRGGTVRNYSAADGLPRLPVIAIVEDSAGTMWLGSDAGLLFLDGERWKKWPSGQGLPDSPVSSAHVDDRGALYVVTPGGLFRRLPTQSRFDEVARLGDASPPNALTTASVIGFLPELLVRSVVTDASGHPFGSDLRSGFRLIGEAGSPRTDRRGRGLQVLLDRDGRLWVATGDQGVWRITRPDSPTHVVERVTGVTGLASDGAFSVLEDRYGNIWVGGTPNGLTRLSPQSFSQLTPAGTVRALAVMPSGRVWVGTSDALIEVVDPDRHPLRAQPRLTGVSVRALHVDPQGTLWVATDRSLLRLVAGASSAAIVRGSERFRQLDSITSHPRLGVLVSDIDQGLLRWTQANGFEPVMVPREVQGSRILTTYADSRGRVWIAFASGDVLLLDAEGGSELITSARGATAGVYRLVHEDDRGAIWLAGSIGITRYADGRIASVLGDDRLPVRRVRALAHDHAGHLWIAISSGIIRIDRGEAERAASEESYQPAYLLYDKSDGLAGLPQLLSDSPAIRTAGGALWFVTSGGLTIVEPRAIKGDAGSPVVNIDSVTVDDHQIPPASGARLPAGARRLQIEYTALNLTSPQKTRFRFRLDGVDSDWVDAGTRHQAAYTNLGPGEYRFRVAVTNALGAWHESGLAWSFSVAPHFYQTRMFAGACVMIVALAAWGAWTVRLRQERKRFSLVLGERARLSREIHDTLLQGLVGVGLGCDALGSDLEVVSPEIKDRFLRLRRDTQRYIKEARQAIWNLRSSSLEREALATAVRRLGEQIAGTAVEFSVTEKGSVRLLAPEVEQQLTRIAHEAVTNAVRHARARHIEVCLEYEPAGLLMRISDDGCGFLDGSPGLEEHYGLLSMRERAQLIQATFQLDSSPGQGTRIEVKVPPLRRHLSAAAL